MGSLATAAHGGGAGRAAGGVAGASRTPSTSRSCRSPAVFTAFAVGTVRHAARVGRGSRTARRAAVHRGRARRRVGSRCSRPRGSHGYVALLVVDGARRACSARPASRQRPGRVRLVPARRARASRSGCVRRRCPPARRSPRSRCRRSPRRPASTPPLLRARRRLMLVAAIAAASGCATGPRVESAAPPAPDAARDPRIWRLSAASSLMIIGQVGLTSLLVLYLYRERDWTAAHAALALGFVQVGAALARVSAGRWSDLRDERIEPFRRLADGGRSAAAARRRSAVRLAVPLLMAGGVAAMSWNGLSFTAAAEISGRRQAGKAMGIQNTADARGRRGVPVGLGALASAVSWHAVFAVMGVDAADRARPARAARGRRATPPPRPARAPRITRPCRRDSFCGRRRILTRARWPASCGRAASRTTTSCGAGRSRTSRASGARSGSGSRSAALRARARQRARCPARSGSRARR